PLIHDDARIRGDLLSESTFGNGGHRALVAAVCELFVVFAGEFPLAGDHLRAAELRDFLGAVPGLPSATAGPWITRAERLTRGERAQDRELAHLLDPTRDDQVRGAAHHGLGGEMHRLLCRSALAVHRHTRYRF